MEDGEWWVGTLIQLNGIKDKEQDRVGGLPHITQCHKEKTKVEFGNILTPTRHGEGWETKHPSEKRSGDSLDRQPQPEV